MNTIKALFLMLCFVVPVQSSATMVNFGGYWVNWAIQEALLKSFENRKVYRTPQKVPVLVLRPFHLNTMERAAAVRKAEGLEETPEGKDPRAHRRAQIDGTPSTVGKAGARLRRKIRERGAVDPDRWFDQYENIRANSESGRAAEEHALEAFNVPSNNVGEVVLVAGEGFENRHRPDGMGVDENEQEVVFEVKRKKAKSVVYATAQMRAEEAAAQEADGRHVVAISTDASSNEPQNFPRPSRGFGNLATEFRLISSDGFVYRWDPDASDWYIVG